MKWNTYRCINVNLKPKYLLTPYKKMEKKYELEYLSLYQCELKAEVLTYSMEQSPSWTLLHGASK